MRSLRVVFILIFLLSFGQVNAQDNKNVPTPERWKQITDDLEQYLQKGMKEWEIPGMAIGIVQGDQVVYTKGFGVKEAGAVSAVSSETIFQIGSTSKAFTAAIAAMLQDEGKFNWEDPVIKYLSDFVMYDPWVTREIEVWELMAQHSGLPGYSADLLSICGFDRNQIIKAIRYIKPISSFRTKYAYQNNMFLAMAALEEKLSGKSWEDNIKERIFKPLGMSDSTLDLASFRQAKDVSFIHMKAKDKIVAVPMDWKYMNWVYTYAPAGGINSNIKDMVKWLKFQINAGAINGKQLISKKNMEFLHSPKTIIDEKISGHSAYYAQAWLYMENEPYPVIWHNGGTSGSKTMIAFVPQEKIGIVILSNLITGFPEDVAFRFFNNYFGKPLKDNITEMKEKEKKERDEELAKIPKAPQQMCPSLPLEQYSGEYQNNVYGKISVSQNNGNLSIFIGPLKAELKLTHWDKNDFTATWPDFDLSETPTFVRFDVDPDNTVSGVIIGAINEDGCGSFEKVQEKK
ncbi:MAG: serine hydrolase [Candidatus Omnitrophica bacterium]|nr:serine hydrolase [Candidatus Omnitrophota bacterium]